MTELDDAQQLAERTAQAFHNKKAIGWAGILRDGQDIIGTCGFNSIEPYNLHAEIGGEMAVEYWGKHLAGRGSERYRRFWNERDGAAHHRSESLSWEPWSYLFIGASWL